MLELPTDFPRHYRYQMRALLYAGKWEYSYELIGSKGGAHLHIRGPHNYDGEDRWTAGLELHSRTPLYADTPPSHDECWLLHCPCWHDGTTAYAQRRFLPLFLIDRHDQILLEMVRWADEKFLDLKSTP